MEGILCFGDSITNGRGEMPNIGWVGRLKNDYEAQGFHNGVYNLGIYGDTSTDLLKRFDAECASRLKFNRQIDKYLIIIAIGTNDCRWDGMPEDNKVRTSTEEEFQDNMTKLIEKAKSYEAKLMFLGIPPIDETKTLPFEETSFKNLRNKLFNNIVKKCCEASDVLFLDLFDEMSKENFAGMLEDGIHPNSKGYGYIYNLVKDFVKNNNLI